MFVILAQSVFLMIVLLILLIFFMHGFVIEWMCSLVGWMGSLIQLRRVLVMLRYLIRVMLEYYCFTLLEMQTIVSFGML